MPKERTSFEAVGGGGSAAAVLSASAADRNDCVIEWRPPRVPSAGILR
jgi:hypothetical protein